MHGERFTICVIHSFIHTASSLIARCMRALLRFRMGTHSLSNVLGQRIGVPGPSTYPCASGAMCMLFTLHDVRHLCLIS